MGGGLTGEAATRTAEALPSSRSGSDTARRTAKGRGGTRRDGHGSPVAGRRGTTYPGRSEVGVRAGSFPAAAWDAVCGGGRGVTDGRWGCRGVGVVGPGPRWWHGVRIAAADHGRRVLGRGPPGRALGEVRPGRAAWWEEGQRRGRAAEHCRAGGAGAVVLGVDRAGGATSSYSTPLPGQEARGGRAMPVAPLRGGGSHRTPGSGAHPPRSGLDQLRFPPKMD